MKASSFKYRGYTFKPIGNILGGWVAKTHCITLQYTLEIKGYTHENFYKVAKKHHASVDVFEVNGELYIPVDTRLVGVLDNAKIKSISEYKRWYQ